MWSLWRKQSSPPAPPLTQGSNALDNSVKLAKLCEALVPTAVARQGSNELVDLEAVQLELGKTKSELDQALQELASYRRFEPKLQALQHGKQVRLNVGGTVFTTNVDNLVREENTYFSMLLSKQPQGDAPYFIDRDPALFGIILKYLRTDNIHVESLTPEQLQLLQDEAQYFQIASLVLLLKPAAFCTQVRNKVRLTNYNTVAVNDDFEFNAYVISQAPFSPSSLEKQVKILRGNRILIGIAPRSILDLGKWWSNCGYFVWCFDGSLYSQNGDVNKRFRSTRIQENSTVGIRLDEDFNLSIRVNDEDWGIAFPRIAESFRVPLHLAVIFSFKKGHKAKGMRGMVEMA